VGDYILKALFHLLLAALRYTVSKFAYAIPLLMAFPILNALQLPESSDIYFVQKTILIGLYAGMPIICRLIAFLYVGTWVQGGAHRDAVLSR